MEIGFLGNHNGQGCQTTLKDKKLEICSQLEHVCVCVCVDGTTTCKNGV